MTMGSVTLLALLANGLVAWMLYAFREVDANMHSVWLCSRNDAIGNAAVFMAALALHGGWTVLRQANGELGEENAKGDSNGHVH